MSVRTKRWTREEYDRMVAAGAFAPDARVQLINGEIVEMTPQSAAHATALLRLHAALVNVFSGTHHVRSQLPLALGPIAEPEPDLAVVPGTIDDYRDHHPTTAVLVVEIADTSLEFDRTRKAAIYARIGIPEYWILNLADRQLEVYRDPEGASYGTRRELAPGDAVSPIAAPEASLHVTSLIV